MDGRNVQLKALTLAITLWATVIAAAPASADFCIRLSGGPFSGDIGFFRFTGVLPTKVGKMKALAGRAAGLSPVFGSATVVSLGRESTQVEIGATFFIDATQGQFDVFLSGPTFTSGSGYGSYGQYGVNSSVSVSVVNCATEP
jgi:hypothetical protein